MKAGPRICGRRLASAKELPALSWHALRALRVFRRPLSILYHYVTRTVPRAGLVELRDGARLHLTGHRDEIAVLFCIFAKREYGQVARGSVVVDVGGNLGAFAIYAARSGARRVYVYEPSTECFGYLLRNLKGFEEVVVCERLAVVGTARTMVKFPNRASPNNRVLADNTSQAHELVGAITLSEVLRQNRLDHVDLLKIDCEGGEYDIVLNTPGPVWEAFREIRLEYHDGPPDKLLSCLRAHGFRMQRVLGRGPGGLIWAERACNRVSTHV